MSVHQGPVMSVPAPPRGLRAPARLVLAVLGGLVLTLIIAGPPLSVLAHQWSASTAGPVADVTALCVVGAVIAWHRPANPLGWILLGPAGPRCSAPTAGRTRCSTTGCTTGRW